MWRCGWQIRLEQPVTRETLLHLPTSVKTRRLAVLICGELVTDPYQQTMPIQNTPLLHRPTLLLVTSTKWRVFLMVQVLWVVTTTKSWQMPDCSIVLNTRSTMPWVISHWKAVYRLTKYWRLPTNIPMVALPIRWVSLPATVPISTRLSSSNHWRTPAIILNKETGTWWWRTCIIWLLTLSAISSALTWSIRVIRQVSICHTFQNRK